MTMTKDFAVGSTLDANEDRQASAEILRSFFLVPVRSRTWLQLGQGRLADTNIYGVQYTTYCNTTVLG